MRITLLNLFAQHGGAETCVRGLHAGLRAKGHEVRLLVGRAQDPPAAQPVEVLPRIYPEFLLQRLLSRLAGLTDTTMLGPLWLARRHPALVGADVLHAHVLNGSYLNLWALPILARRVPLVITLHDMWLLTGDCDHSEHCRRWQRRCGACPLSRRPWGMRNSLGWGDLTRLNLAIKRAVFRRVPTDRLVLVSPSRWLADLAAQSHLGRFRVEVVPNGVDLVNLAPAPQDEARAALGWPPTGNLFLAIAGSWNNPHKGSDLLVPLAQAIRAEQLGRLVVTGKVPAGLAAALREGGATVAGPLEGPAALRQAYSACTATLVLSRNENFPYVVSESLACGTPVIGRGVGGIPEMLAPGQHGFLLGPQAGVPAYVEAIRKTAQCSPAEWRARREAARRHAEACLSVDQMVARHDEIYGQLTAVQFDRPNRRIGRSAA